MKNLTSLNRYRIEIPEVCIAGSEDELDLTCNGCFRLSLEDVTFSIIASRGKGWEHISVS